MSDLFAVLGLAVLGLAIGVLGYLLAAMTRIKRHELPELFPGERVEFRHPSGSRVVYVIVHVQYERNGTSTLELQDETNFLHQRSLWN